MKLKPFLGVDITHDSKNSNYDGDVFIIDKVSLDEAAVLDKAAETVLDTESKASLSWPLLAAKLLCEFMGLIFGFAILKGIHKNSFAESYERAPWMFWCAAIGLLGWGALAFYEKKKRKSTYENSDIEASQAELNEAVNDIYEKFGVPADAPYVDILSFSYKVKNGEYLHKNKISDITSHHNYAERIFIEGESLIIADRDYKYAFPLSSIKKIHTVKKQISIPFWHKDTAYNKGEYKQYKMTTNQFGSIFMKRYHILELDRNGVAWGIYFPCYELPIIESITGLKAENE